ncbi:hypothetical protein Q3G72_001936 [Acer saccharum]|nr:hypothetical protein Q3G72_001936 [Acer saccharum]
MDEWMDGWLELCPAVSSNRIWKVVFHAICWSVWEIRNDVVFNQGASDFDRVIEMVKWRAAGWFKHFGQGSKCSVAFLMMNLKVGCVDSSKVKRMVKCGWKPPMVGSLKFNVDGSSRGNPGLSGIGGVLRNSDGDIVCLFSAPIGVGSAMDSEVQAILKACQMCVNELCPADVNITIECDSQAAVSCVNGAGEIFLLIRVFRVAWCKKPGSEIFRAFGCCGGVNNTLAVGAAIVIDFSEVEVEVMAEITRREYEDLARCAANSMVVGRAVCLGAVGGVPILGLFAPLSVFSLLFSSAPVVVAVCALVCMVVLLG